MELKRSKAFSDSAKRKETGYDFPNANLKTTNPSHNKDKPKTTGECEVF
jgi:hypothetical protein